MHQCLNDSFFKKLKDPLQDCKKPLSDMWNKILTASHLWIIDESKHFLEQV